MVLLGLQSWNGYSWCLETPYRCWYWLRSHDVTNYGVRWIPEDYCGDPPHSGGGYVSGGWLAGQPDDGGADCVEDGEEQRMQFVFNRGGNADSNGFADAAEGELRQALVVRPADTVGFPADPVWAWEFRYAGARRRYLTRQLDPVTLEPMADGDVWSDYLGDSIWGDYTVDDGTATMTARYVPGLWQTDLTPLGDEPPGVPTTGFVHANMLGTTRMLSSGAGAAIPDASRLYTAFGIPAVEPASPMTRYGYAGAWGYQSNSALSTQNSGLLHLGARYYDPSLGRFLQRDPIGIFGGLNVYAYVGNNPTMAVDPEGLVPSSFWPPNTGRYRYGPSRLPGAPPSAPRPWAFRFPGPKGGPHWYGARGAAAFGLSCAVAAGTGAVAGRVIDNSFGNSNNGFRISDGLAVCRT